MFRKLAVATETHELSTDRSESVATDQNNEIGELTSNELDGVSGGAEIRVTRFWIIPDKIR